MQGCKQKGPWEHKSVYASVVKGVTIRLIVALACMLRLYIHQMNVPFAILTLLGNICGYN